jgi:hypothetical protein
MASKPPVLAPRSIGPLIDNLNVSIHVRAVLTDRLLGEEVLTPRVALVNAPLASSV